MGAAGSGPEHELVKRGLILRRDIQRFVFLKDPDTEMVALDDGTAI